MSKRKPKPLTIYSATKEELIQYFFQVDYFGGGHRIGADKERFLLWLKRKRSDEALKGSESAQEKAHDAFEKYLESVRMFNHESDYDKKMEYAKQSNHWWDIYEKFIREADKLMDKSMDIWDDDEPVSKTAVEK